MSCAHSLSPPLPVRPDDYKCCDAYDNSGGMFGCQKGLTPTNATGSLPDVVPFDSISGWPGDMVWQSAGEVIPAGALRAEGNIAYVALLWPYISAHMAFAAQAAADGTNGLLKFGPYSDWLAAEPVSLAFAANFYLVYAAQLAARMASMLGRAEEAVALAALAEAKSDAMVAVLFNATRGTWDGGVNANAQAMALAVGLGGAATAGRAPATVAAMIADVQSHGGHPTGGVASIRWTLQGLTAANRTDVALAMATIATAPSWAYMATPDMPGTIWESWKGDAHSSDGSKNHPMFSGGIGIWLYDTALGLSFKHAPRGGGTSPDVAARLRAKSRLGFDLRSTAAFSDAEANAVLDLAAEVRAGAILATMPSLLARASALGVVAQRAASPHSLDPVFTAIPDASIVRIIGAASGYRMSPQGQCALRWQYNASAGNFNMDVTLPSGTLGRVGVPLALIQLAPYIVVHHDGVELLSGEVHVTDVNVNSCDGVLLGQVDGRHAHLCGAMATVSSAIGRRLLDSHPRLASRFELEGEGRIDFTDAGTTWGNGGLIFEVSAPGEYLISTHVRR